MNATFKVKSRVILASLLFATLSSLARVGAAEDERKSITLIDLAGAWQITVVGNTGCGPSSLLFTGTMDSSGVATGTLTGSSGCGLEQASTQTFTIKSLAPNGSGTANLGCGTGCGWDFFIQVSPNEQVFNLVDLDATNNYLAGTAVKQLQEKE